ETLEFVKKLHEKQIPYLFLTNNSTKTPEMVCEVLQAFGYPVTPQQVYTPSLAAADYIADEQKEATVYVIGEIGLQSAIVEKGLSIVEENADYVVIGLDREITYEKLAKGALQIRKGAKFISTNGDVAIPTERGLLPGNGSLTSVLTVTTGVDPLFIGKPEKIIMEKALQLINLQPQDVAMIGDNYFTDILAGINAGLPTIFIETGVSTRAEVEGYDALPTHLLNTLAEFEL
ncbi:MAG TPA: TIGR01457 family HAD-type hydrolase, partial [Firmicutes bacterium]|nr:TIGR01457 family HAD-type hydrolase [Bacillota bacterium]